MSEATTQPENDDSSEEMSQAEMDTIIDRHCVQLGEHFDSVRIFVTSTAADSQTRGCSRGHGNYYAQRGVIDDWLIAQKARTARDAANDD